MCFQDGHHLWLSVLPYGLTEEAQSGRSVPVGGEQKVDSLAIGVNGPVQILPLAFGVNVGLIHACANVSPPGFCAVERPGSATAPDE